MRPLALLAVATLLSATVPGQKTPGSPSGKGPAKPPVAKAPRENPYLMRIARWDSMAACLRKKKAEKTAKVGFALKVADMLSAGPKHPIAVFAGAVGYQEIQPRSAVRYASFRPTTLDPMKRSDIDIELTRGEIRHRTGPLLFGTTYKSRSGPRLAASAGTAYSVRVVSGGLEVLVAEGSVKIALTASPEKTLTIAPRQKAIIGRTLPPAAVPVTPADEARIRALLSLPISSLIGYTDPTVLWRKDAEEIVTLRVRPALLVERAESGTAKWRPFSVVVTRAGFWSVNEFGLRREIGKGLTFVGASPSGRAILGVDGKRDLWSQDLEGKRKQLVANGFQSLLTLAPDGQRAAVKLKTTYVEGAAEPGRVTIRHTVADFVIHLDSPYRKEFGAAPEDAVEYVWLADGTLLVLITGEKNSRTFAPEAALDSNQMTEEMVRRAVAFSGPGRWTLTVSPSKRWLFARRGTDVRIVDLSTGRGAALSGVASITELAGAERILAVGADRRIVSRTVTGLISDELPITPAMPTDVPPTLDLTYSPNGELVTFRDADTRTAIVADSLNLARRSDTYVGFGFERKHSWVSGDELLYEPLTPDSPDAVLIKLGIKRFGARPRGFEPRTALRPSGGFGFSTLALPTATEIHVMDVSANGRLVGFVKESNPMGIAAIFTTSFRQDADFHLLGDVSLPEFVGDDGLIVGSGFAYLPNGSRIVPPDSLQTERSLGMDAKGRTLYGNSLWDPRATGAIYPFGRGLPYGGKASLLQNGPSGISPVGMNRVGQVMWAEEEGNRRRFWIGLANEAPVLGLGRIGYGEAKLGEDGVAYLQGGTMERDGREFSTITRYRLDAETEPMLPEPYTGSLWLMGATKTGIPYGQSTKPMFAGSQMKGGDKGFVLVDRQVLFLDDLLDAGYTCRFIRRITDRGDIAGAFFKDGKPVGYIPNLNTLLARRKKR